MHSVFSERNLVKINKFFLLKVGSPGADLLASLA